MSLFIRLQYITPQRSLTALCGWLANRSWPILKNAFIRFFIRQYDVNMQEAVHPNASDYATFNAFFTRHLKPGARPIEKNATQLISPVDGKVYQTAAVQDGELIQAKGKSFSLQALLGDNNTSHLEAGYFTTLYLSPKDYHRVHMPIDGKLARTTYIPGQLFSVNPITTAHVDNLFARNERLICHFDTEHGPLVVIFVGAMIVGSIHTSWAGQVKRGKQGQIVTTDYQDQALHYAQGDEIGFFQLGSTIILLTPNANQISSMTAIGQSIKMGQPIAQINA